MKLLVPAMLAVMAWLSLPQARAAMGPYEDIPIGPLPAAVVKDIVQKNLTPQGRFVIVMVDGTVRVFDTPQAIEKVRKALVAMQNAPALVSFAFIIKTGMHKVTKVTSDGSGVGVTIPVPATYAPPQIVASGRGYVVVPAYPTSFVNEPVGIQDTVTETSIEGGTMHRFGGATLFPKPVAVTICAKAPDPAGLHDWAVKSGAVPQNEPAWGAARTEILVTPQHADDGMVLNLQPQVVVAAADGSPRVIPLRTCTATVVIKQGASVTIDGFPGADPEFYRLFLGAQESTDDSLSSVTVGAVVDYTAAAQQPQGQPQQPAQTGQPQPQAQPVPQAQPAPQPVPQQIQPDAPVRQNPQNPELIDISTQ